jgi:Dolichyl-phosphate-mannose-protein mannosyltransferase
MSQPIAIHPVGKLQNPLILSLIALYVAACAYRFDDAPVICNDAAQEVMSGYLNLFTGVPQVMTFFPSDNGVETLWVGIAGLFIAVLGQETLPAVMSSWLAVALMLVFIWRLAERHRQVVDPLLAVLAAMSMLWVFHYARGSMRAISAATFLAANLWALSIFLQSPKGWRGPIMLGGSLALGIYAYTTSRVPPIAYALFLVVHLAIIAHRSRPQWTDWLKHHARCIGVAIVVSIPNILFAIQHPAQFFQRGSYNIRGSIWSRIDYVVESLATPIWYDAAKYREVATQNWLFDIVACTLPRLNLSPVPLAIGVAATAGVFMFKRYRPMNGILLFAGAVYILTCILIGFMGPSLSRIAIVIPVIAILSGICLTAIAQRAGPRGYLGIALALIALTGLGIHNYLGKIDSIRYNFGMGLTAREIGRDVRDDVLAGKNVLVVLSKDLNTVRFYAQSAFQKLTILDLYGHEFSPELLPEDLVRQFDLVYVTQDQEPDRSPHLPRQTEEARAWLDTFLAAPTHQPVGRYFVYQTARQSPTSRSTD